MRSGRGCARCPPETATGQEIEDFSTLNPSARIADDSGDLFYPLDYTMGVLTGERSWFDDALQFHEHLWDPRAQLC
jgi:hypothetical protein